MLSNCLKMLVSSTSCIEVKNPEDQEKDYDYYYYSAKTTKQNKKNNTMTTINNDHQLSRQADKHTVTSTSELVVRSRRGT